MLRPQVVMHDAVDWGLDTVSLDPCPGSVQRLPLRLIGGVDISFFPEREVPQQLDCTSKSSSSAKGGDEQQPAGVAALVVLSYPELNLVSGAFSNGPAIDQP